MGKLKAEVNQWVALNTLSPEREGGMTFRHSSSLFVSGQRTLLSLFQFRGSGR